MLFRNGLVLALHSLACVAGFMAGSSLPQVAEGYRGVWRKIHELAGPLAIAFVGAATLFSLATQAYALGGHASTLAADLGVSPLVLVLGILPHALPELFALFLPLAAWTLASRARRWDELLAATFVTTAIAIPILMLAGAVEVWVSPRLLLALAGCMRLAILSEANPDEETAWPAASPKSPTATSRPRSSSPRPRCWSTSGPPGAARAAS